MAYEPKLGEVILKDVRLSFPHLDKPKASAKDGPEKFRANFLLEPGSDNHKRIKKAVGEVKKEVWGTKADAIKLKEDRLCVKRGDDQVSQNTGEVYDGYEGMIAVVASNGGAVHTVDRKKRPIPQDKINSVLYAGCRVDAVIRFWGTKDPDKGGNGVFASLEAVRFRGDDEPFGMPGVDVDEVFDDLDDDDDDLENEADDAEEGDEDDLV